jgi:hypothetical protein
VVSPFIIFFDGKEQAIGGQELSLISHGALNLQIATLADTKLIYRAQKQARNFVTSGSDLLQYKQLADSVKYYQRLTTLN